MIALMIHVFYVQAPKVLLSEGGYRDVRSSRKALLCDPDDLAPVQTIAC